MARIASVTVIDGVMRTTYDDDYFNELIIPVGYHIQVRVVKDVVQRKDTMHYKYAECNIRDRAHSPLIAYSKDVVTCKRCLQAILANRLLLT
jgi:hypothetical protein